MKLTWLERKRTETTPPPAPEPPIENLETPLGSGKTYTPSDYKESTKSLRFDLNEDGHATLFVVMVRELNTEGVNFRIRQEETHLVWIEL